MNLSPQHLRDLMRVAVKAARDAGEMIAASRPSAVERKDVGSSPSSQVVTEIDRQAEAMVVDELAPTLSAFDLGLLTEEREDSGDRLRKDFFWCIDPLDGTLPFVQSNEGHAVSVALVSRLGVPHIGVVHDPVGATTYHAARACGLYRDGELWAPATTPRNAKLSFFPDPSWAASEGFAKTRQELEFVAAGLGLTGVEVGPVAGAVLNACRILSNPPACYFKLPKSSPGGGSLWDFAATACLFAEAGAVATDMAGAPLELNRSDSTFMNHRGVMFATDERLAQALRAASWTRSG